MDGSQEIPIKAAPSRTEFGGKGLLFVDAMATRWGSRIIPDGKVVFFSLDLSPVAGSAA
jgi:hypothetical protein